MKNQIHKYTVVAVAALLALEGIYLLAKQAGLISGRIAASAQARDAMDRAPMKKKAVLLEAGLGREEVLQSCYQDFLRTEPKIDEGTVEVHWMIDARGKILSMDMVRSDFEDLKFEECLLEKIRKMTLRPPPKAQPTLVAHKFNFHKRVPASLDFKQASGTGNSSEE